MLNLNINKLTKDNKAGGLDTSSFIFPLSAGLSGYRKLQLDENKKTNIYQYCDKCKCNTGHVSLLVDSKDYIACVNCSVGYKIGR